MGFDQDALTCDKFLGGQLHIWQPREGYRAGVDPVLLAAATPAKAGQSVLELGCGVGTASLCLGRRVAGLSLAGVEVQGDYADLARRNSADNGIPFEVVEADLRALPPELRAQSFDHVIANPPYFDPLRRTAAEDAGRETALAGETALSDWCDIAARRLRPKGRLTMIQRIERLTEVLSAAQGAFGGLTVTPFQARPGKDIKLFILQAVKGGRGAFVLKSPILMHNGPRHDRDGESYTAQIQSVLRDGAGLS